MSLTVRVRRGTVILFGVLLALYPCSKVNTLRSYVMGRVGAAVLLRAGIGGESVPTMQFPRMGPSALSATAPLAYLLTESPADDQDCAMLMGRIMTVLGKPDRVPACEALYSFTVLAKDSGAQCVLSVIQRDNIPQIVGENTEFAHQAAQVLAEQIANAAPKTYTWSGRSESGTYIQRYAVQNGTAAALRTEGVI